MKKVRVSGLVKIMRWAREQLAAGIPPEHAEDFRRQVRKTLAELDEICRVERIRPEDFPVPSYRAYRFLRDLDLDALPLRQSPAPVAKPKTVRITNIVSAQDSMNMLFSEWLASAEVRKALLAGQTPDLSHFSLLLQRHVDEIETLAEEQGGTPGQLPTPSCRAYQWLKFLSDPDNLLLHLQTLRKVLAEFHKPACRSRIPAERRDVPVAVEFAYSTHLYRVRAQAETLQVTLHEGFCGAPADVLRALVCTILLNDKGNYLDTLKRYAGDEAFVDVVLALELTTENTPDHPRGQVYDLDAAFARVNAAYFGGLLARPRLTWNQALTRRKLGHYDFVRDTVMLSVTLDAANVPEYVVDFVMYHELLHKQLGVNVVNGRRYAHTPEFREAEKRFARYAEARAFLKAPGWQPD